MIRTTHPSLSSSTDGQPIGEEPATAGFGVTTPGRFGAVVYSAGWVPLFAQRWPQTRTPSTLSVTTNSHTRRSWNGIKHDASRTLLSGVATTDDQAR